jgi:CHAT domain-containing protein
MTGEPAKRTETHTNISSLQLRLRRSESPKDRALLLDAIFEAEQQLKLEAAPVSGRGDPVDVRALQEVLREDEVVFEYVLSQPKSFCLVISNSELTPVTLNGGRQIQDKVERYLSVIRSGEADRRLGKELFDSLVRPMSAHLEQKSRLIIVPDGNLHWLPFETLVGPDGKYLLQSHAVTAVPSSTVLHLLRTRERPEERMLPILAVGNVVYESTSRVQHIDTTRGLYDIDGERFGSLPSTLKEVSELAKIAGAKTVLLVGEQATEASFKSQPLSMFKVLHLALHGIASTKYPERAALVFSQPAGSKEDGLLQAWEIGQLSLAADLVTLSACNTGVGRLEGQEGVANLVRAFLFAGARSVAASQWSVDDVFTAALMRRFYTRLAEGLDRASALRMAKLDLIERHGAEITPYYWAAFTLVGKGSMPTVFTR